MLNLIAVLTFISLLVFVILSVVYWTLRNGISPMPSGNFAKEAILELSKKTNPQKVYELGSGWGTLLIPLGYAHPSSVIIGYEISPIPYFISLARIKWSGLKNVFVLRKDFHQTDISDASLIVCYLYPGGMEKLKIKLEKELKNGAFVISNTFAVPGWKPLETLKVPDLLRTTVYLYRR